MSDNEAFVIMAAMVVSVVGGLSLASWWADRRAARRTLETRDPSAPPSPEPVFNVDMQREHRGSHFVVVRERLVYGGKYPRATNRATESIAVQMPPSACRFVIDYGIYRGQSDLYEPIRERSALGLEIGPPFWRSDEPERLEHLKREPRFRKIVDQFLREPDFGALAVVGGEEARVPLDSPARRLRHEGDILVLSRRGEQVPYRDDNALRTDLDHLLEMRDLLSRNIVPSQLPRAGPHSLARAAGTRALRTVVLFFLVVAGLGVFFWLMSHC